MAIIDEVAVEDPLIGEVLDGKYRLLGALGAGGMGKVYRAEQLALHREVAVKVLDASDSHRDADPAVERRFFLEASLCAKLSHPNVVTVHDYGRVELKGTQRFFIAMELLEGDTLHRRLGKGATVMSVVDTLNLGMEITRGLRAAHKAGLIHRDLKPGNIMLLPTDDGERVKILDFGLVKQVGSDLREDITQEGTFLGSPRYMAPEQVSASPVDHRCDLYSLGIILYQCLTGRTPFEGSAPMDVLVQHMTAPVPPMIERNAAVHVPPAMEQIVRRLLEKTPSNRYADAEALLSAFREAKALVTGDATVASKSATGQFSQLAVSAQAAAPPQVTSTISSGEPSVTIAGTTYSSAQPNAPSQSKSRPIGLIVAALSVSLGLAGLAAYKMKSGDTPVAAIRTEPTTGNAGRVAVPERVQLQLSSSPTGARVRENGVVLGVTPMAIAIDSTGSSRTFEVLLDGYLRYEFVQGPSAQSVMRFADLRPDPAAVIAPPPPAQHTRTPVVQRNPPRARPPLQLQQWSAPPHNGATPPPGEAIRMIR